MALFGDGGVRTCPLLLLLPLPLPRLLPKKLEGPACCALFSAADDRTEEWKHLRAVLTAVWETCAIMCLESGGAGLLVEKESPLLV